MTTSHTQENHVRTGATVWLTGLPSAGKTTIALELAGRLGVPGDGGSGVTAAWSAAGRADPWREQVRAGLVNLGWPARDADQAIAAIEPELNGSADAQADGAA